MVIHTCTTIILTWHFKLYIQDFLLDFYLPRIELYVKLRQRPSPLLKPLPHIVFLLCWRTELHLVWINELLISLGQPRHHQRDLPVSSLGKVCSSKQWVYSSPSHPRQARCGKYRNMLLLPRHGHRTTHSTSAPQLLLLRLQCPRDSDTSTFNPPAEPRPDHPEQLAGLPRYSGGGRGEGGAYAGSPAGARRTEARARGDWREAGGGAADAAAAAEPGTAPP